MVAFLYGVSFAVVQKAATCSAEKEQNRILAEPVEPKKTTILTKKRELMNVPP